MAVDAPPHKAFGITNIKTYVPLVRDLGRLNYDAWRELFTTHCVGFDVIDHIDTSTPKQTDAEWKKVDTIVKLWIYGSISQSLLHMVLKKDTTALQVWNNLETLFHDNKDAKSMQIDNELQNIVMGDLTVTAYYTNIKAMADLLANLDPDSTVPDKHLVIYTINGLSPKFVSVANIIQYRSPLPTFIETCLMLLLEEQRMSSPRLVSTGNSTDNSSSPSVLHTGNGSSNRPNNRRPDRRQQQQRRRQQPLSAAPNQPYGWVFIPPLEMRQQPRTPSSAPSWQQQTSRLLGIPSTITKVHGSTTRKSSTGPFRKLGCIRPLDLDRTKSAHKPTRTF